MADKIRIFNKTGEGKVSGEKTHIAVTEFTDKYFIIISDTGKIGSLIQVCFDKEETSSSKVIFGKDNPEINAIACAIANKCHLTKPTIFGLNLQAQNSNVVSDILEILLPLFVKD